MPQTLATQRLTRLLRAEKEREGLSDEKLGKPIGYSQSRVSGLLRGEGKDITSVVIVRACAAYKAHPLWFFDPQIPDDVDHRSYDPGRSLQRIEGMLADLRREIETLKAQPTGAPRPASKPRRAGNSTPPK